MSDEKPSEILGGLPRSRPQRRSSKRSTGPAPTGGRAEASAPKPAQRQRLRQPKQPGGTPPKPPTRKPLPPSGPEVLSTVVQAATELVELGLSASARAVRNALGRLPRP